MSTPRIQTQNLDLVLSNREETIASIEAMLEVARAQLSADWLTRLYASAHIDPWVHGFSMVHRGSGVNVGSCGFKGPLAADGTVEIAYGLDPDHQGKGYATEAAEALVIYAFADPRVRLVLAHTLPERNASGRVLTKCGFRQGVRFQDKADQCM